MGRFKVAVTDYVFPDLEVERKLLETIGASLVAGQSRNGRDVVELAHDADAILNTYYGPLDESVIGACPKLKIIVRFGIGVDTIDIAAATRHGVMVANVPDYCVEEVSDHAVAMWLCLARKILAADRAVRGGDWTLSAVKPLTSLGKLKAGIVGMGRIGRRTARKAAAFCAEVVFADPSVEEDIALEGILCRKVDLDDLCADSDVIFLHAPANKTTRHILNAARFKLMTRKPIIVNTARAELIDHEALAEALAAGRLGGAALDVVEGGKLPADHPLLKFDNVLITPHSAWYSDQAIGLLRRLATQEVIRGLTGERPKSLLNPEVWDD